MFFLSEIKNDYINGNFRRLAYSFTQDFANNVSIYKTINEESIRSSNSETHIENLQLTGVPTTDEEDNQEFEITTKDALDYRDLNYEPNKCLTPGCSGFGSTRTRKDGTFYKSHKDIANCPYKKQGLEKQNCKKETNINYTIVDKCSESSSSSEQEYFANDIINHLSFYDEINAKFADEMNTLTNSQALKIKKLEKNEENLKESLAELQLSFDQMKSLLAERESEYL